MAKVFSIHEVELRPGVTAEEFERFLKTEYMSGALPMPIGWSVAYLQGNRGIRAGKYVVLYEVASVEERDNFFPEAGTPSAKFHQYNQLRTTAQQALEEKMSTYVTASGESFTDYTVIAG